MTPAEIEKEAERILKGLNVVYVDSHIEFVLSALRAVHDAAIESVAKQAEDGNIHSCCPEETAHDIRAPKMSSDKSSEAGGCE